MSREKQTNTTYIFDLGGGRPIAVFAQDEEQQGPPELLWQLIDHLGARGRDDILRRFAFSCGSALEQGAPPSAARMLKAAQSVLQGHKPASWLKVVRDDLRSMATAATVVGLRHGAANAAAFMGIYACLNENAAHAATDAARMQQEWAVLKARYDERDGEPERKAVEEWQRDRLLALCGERA